jgi:hypothetical protein
MRPPLGSVSRVASVVPSCPRGCSVLRAPPMTQCGMRFMIQTGPNTQYDTTHEKILCHDTRGTGFRFVVSSRFRDTAC